jgi:hypothetical protein
MQIIDLIRRLINVEQLIPEGSILLKIRGDYVDVIERSDNHIESETVEICYTGDSDNEQELQSLTDLLYIIANTFCPSTKHKDYALRIGLSPQKDLFIAEDIRKMLDENGYEIIKTAT